MSEAITDAQKLEDKLEETNKEMRDRSHQLSAVLQAHTSEIAVMRVIAGEIGDLKTAVYGDLKSGVETGIRGAVQKLYMQLLDTEKQRNEDRKREEEQFEELARNQEKHTEAIEKLNARNERRGGAFGLIREIGNTISVIAVAGGLVVGVIELVLKANHR